MNTFKTHSKDMNTNPQIKRKKHRYTITPFHRTSAYSHLLLAQQYNPQVFSHTEITLRHMKYFTLLRTWTSGEAYIPGPENTPSSNTKNTPSSDTNGGGRE
jgi:hypothetical protein